jgi:hypothetical protein
MILYTMTNYWGISQCCAWHLQDRFTDELLLIHSARHQATNDRRISLIQIHDSGVFGCVCTCEWLPEMPVIREFSIKFFFSALNDLNYSDDNFSFLPGFLQQWKLTIHIKFVMREITFKFVYMKNMGLSISQRNFRRISFFLVRNDTLESLWRSLLAGEQKNMPPLYWRGVVLWRARIWRRYWTPIRNM